MIDLSHARQQFNAYLDSFDRENDKIKLKIVHTDGVVQAAYNIISRMHLSRTNSSCINHSQEDIQEDIQLAQLIALLHDIGRFEQVRRFNSFEPFTMDHALFGVELLFGEDKMIRNFIEDDTYDDLIKTAIERHSLYDLEEPGPIDDPRTLLHARLIRDADKLDNCRVKLEDPIEVLLGVRPEEVGRQTISDVVWKSCMDHRSVKSADRVTKMDYWVSYIAYFNDINFKETYDIILENDYVNRIIDRVPYSNDETKEKMEILRVMFNSGFTAK